MRNKFFKSAAVFLLLITLTACSAEAVEPTRAPESDTPTQTLTPYIQSSLTPSPTPNAAPTLMPTSTPSPTPIIVGPDDFPEGVNPLTGLLVPDPSILDRLPVSVKINNYPRSDRPQWGLSAADIVYEYYHNNWLTRFHAIFYGQDSDLVGPIRSGRLYDALLMESYSSILAFASADYRILNKLYETNPQRLLFGIEAPCPPDPICRLNPETDNHLVGSTSALTDYAAANGLSQTAPDLSGMYFSSIVPGGGMPGSQLTIRYSISAYSQWRYNSEKGEYHRFQDAVEAYSAEDEQYLPLTDRANDAAIMAENLAVLFVPHSRAYYKEASGSDPMSEIINIEMDGFGSAVVFRDGLAYSLQWIRTVEDPRIRLVDANGREFPLKPGKTWFQVISEESAMLEDDGSWRFEFIFPPGS